MADLSPSIRYLREMIAIPSVNPMGRDDLPVEITGEQAIAEHVAHQLSRLGLDSALVGRAGRKPPLTPVQKHCSWPAISTPYQSTEW
jgi:hypothetical protein